MDEVFDAITGRSYPVAHLKAKAVPFHLLLDREQVSIHLHVYYANHCYTRSRTADDPDDTVLFRELKRDGTYDERIFCPKRYEFSVSWHVSLLPDPHAVLSFAKDKARLALRKSPSTRGFQNKCRATWLFPVVGTNVESPMS